MIVVACDSKSLWNYVELIQILVGCSFVERANGNSSILQILQVLFVQVATPHILVRAAVPSLACRDAVTLGSKVHAEPPDWDFLGAVSRFVYLVVRFVEVLSCVVGVAEGGAIEVVEHQVHVLGLLVLQIVPDFDISVHWDFYVCRCAAK